MYKSIFGFVVGVGVLVALVLGFWDGFTWNLRSWNREEYSHSYLMPLIIAYLVWQNLTENGRVSIIGSWAGVLLFAVGLMVIAIGEFSTLYPVIGYGFVFSIWGLAWAWLGNPGFRRLFPALALLIFTVPLPSFIFNSLSSQLQLISSQLGVVFIRLFDISVYIEGNVIDLGAMKLQVVEACSGLRYLFPLMALAFIMALFFRAPMWKRVLLFVSSIPITVFMNSFRIGVIGVLVEFYGQGMAEGFLHDFEGWAVFMAALGVLAGEMWLLGRWGASVTKVRSAPGSKMSSREVIEGSSIYSFVPVLFTLVLALPLSLYASSIDTRQEVVPDREIFANFPLNQPGWATKRQLLDGVYIDELDFDDYILADFSSEAEGGNPVNFYVAWYDSQRKGESAHSPKTCLPGGGWVIEAFGQSSADFGEGKVRQIYNRVVINKKGDRQLVYYWFSQRGRVLTNEYLVKWYLFWDALNLNRTDGALVRFTTSVGATESLDKADEKLQRLMSQLVPVLPVYFGE